MNKLMFDSPRRALALALALAGGLLLGCGGVAPPTVFERGQSLDLAPTWMAELDLPGCPCELAAGAQLLRHPFDDQLLIALVDGVASCVGADPNALAIGAPMTAVWAASINPGGPVEDDPVPIRPDGDPRGSGDQGSSGGTEGAESERSSLTGNTVRPLVADDPVPIRDNRPVPVQVTAAVRGG